MSEQSVNSSSSDGDQLLGKKKSTHRRMVSFPTLDELVAKGKQLISSSSELYSIEDAERLSSLSSNSTKGPSSATITDPSTPSTIQHRRNRSDPVTSASLEDLSLENEEELTVVIRRSLHEEPTESPQRRSLTQFPPKSKSKKKRKSWYNPFQTNYTERQEELHKLFKELPTGERLLADYSCAWQKEILVQGRMYLSTSGVGFHANLFSWKTSVSLKFSEIVAISREKTAKVISNAIEIKTNKGEKYFFASFITRDKTFVLLHRLWQATINEETIPMKEYTNIVQENYADDCDVTEDEDEEEEITPTVQNEQRAQVIPSDSLIIPPTADSIPCVSSLSLRSVDPGDLSSPARFPYLSQCLCPKHYSTEFIDRTLSVSISRLFDYIFADGPFNAAYREARRMKDFRSDGWQVNNERGKRERLANYIVTVNSPIGTKTVATTERQIVDCEVSGSHSIVETEIRNEGVPYADSFYLLSRFCLIQTGPTTCHLKITAEVKFVKSIIGFMKCKKKKTFE